MEEFIGRRAELNVFERSIIDARRGLPSVMLVGGDAGIGKTTIVGEAAARAGVAVYLGRSTYIGGGTIPLAPVTDLLRQVRRSRPDLVPPDLVSAVHDRGSQGGMFLDVLELLQALSADDAVIVGIDDLHWADATTWDLFEYLARNLIDERAVLVGTYRTSEVATSQVQRRRLAELQRLPATRRIQLEGWQRDEVAAHVRRLVGPAAPHTLVDQVVTRGQGNPFFTQELVAAHLSGESIPVVLSDLISTEIADLGDDARAVLGAAAVIGREASHGLLSAVVPLADIELEAAIRAVIDARLLVVTNEAYTFRHPLLGEVVYADLLPPQRVRLHRRIAEVLREQSTDAPLRADRAGELAFHLDHAGDTVGAFVASLAAADAAQAVAPAVAFAHLERALQLWDAVGDAARGERRAHRLWQAAELATTTVGNARAAELARAASTLGPPPLGAAWGHERLGRYLWSSGQLVESRAEFEQAAAHLTDDDPGAARVFAGLGQAALMSGDYS